MDEIKASPVVNPRMAALAKLLRAGRDVGNKATFSPSIPLVGGQGLGDLVLGKAPEEVENWGYGNMPVRMPEMSNIPMVKTGRKDGLADAAGLLPFSGGGAEKAMLTAMGNPKYLVSRATSADNLVKALRQSKSLRPNTSFGITNTNPIDADAWGDVTIMPHPRSVDPQYVPKNMLWNADTYSGYGPLNEIGDRRLGHPVAKDLYHPAVLRAAVAPRFNSFKHFETSPDGARVLPLMHPEEAPDEVVPSSILRYLSDIEKDPQWHEKMQRNPKIYADLIRQSQIPGRDIAEFRKHIASQFHAELLTGDKLPFTPSNIQIVLSPADDFRRLKRNLSSTGVPVIRKSVDDPLSQMIELQKKAKF